MSSHNTEDGSNAESCPQRAQTEFSQANVQPVSQQPASQPPASQQPENVPSAAPNAQPMQARLRKCVEYEGMECKRVRDAVRHIRNSLVRLRKFRECVEYEGLECKNSLCLDVPTRWNSTYLMLNTAEKYEKAFERYEEQETSFEADLGSHGVPKSNDWGTVRKIAGLLKHFYKMPLRISGSLYVTSNTFFSEVSDLCCILNEWKTSNDLEVLTLGESMKTKFDKYWGDPEKMNKLIFWSNVFDPRDKLEYMEYSFCEMYGTAQGEKMFKFVTDELVEVFNEYYQPENVVSASGSGPSFSSTSSGNASDSDSISSKPSAVLKTKFKKQKMESGGGVSKKSELDIYLSEAIVEDDSIEVLKWWKMNAERFPVLSKIARDILVVPIFTVASESAFSTGGRVLDAFRSSLTPKIVEALICSQDWLCGELPKCVEEQLEELEAIEQDLPNVGIWQTRII